jgi:hypothetical protein
LKNCNRNIDPWPRAVWSPFAGIGGAEAKSGRKVPVEVDPVAAVGRIGGAVPPGQVLATVLRPEPGDNFSITIFANFRRNNWHQSLK